jgi:protease IV
LYDSAGANDLVIEQFQESVKKVIDNPQIAAVIVRVSSPGGDALASDLMWRQMQLLKTTGKPIIASVSSVAASGK